ncbi:MAG: hypothetical protein NTNFB01_05150 [Nitrospira sp.]|jgi:hypothetical protein
MRGSGMGLILAEVGPILDPNSREIKTGQEKISGRDAHARGP